MPIARRALLVGAAALAARPAAARSEQPLRFAVSAGPLAQLLTFVAEIARRQDGLAVRLVETSDWVTPNEAVNAGDLDVNFFQHSANLAVQVAQRGYRLVAADPAGVIIPVGLFSKRVKSLAEVPDGATVAVANDPINNARGLLLLQRAGLIHLKPVSDLRITVRDILDNPKRLRIVELDAAQLYRSLDDVTLAMVNLTYLIPAGGDPKSALLLDTTADEHFIIRFVTRPENRGDARLRRFLTAFKSDDTRRFIAARLPAFIPAF
ncbi:MetQ/NlpA family ABC transporter substrate-binding protein [Phreatobacter sp. AB_2022a]|uniref:MetQ/NlpA family ABC transporter substrate-binding protein n=1 Tax=Phreatobacter sp. AB_2022a TaxID=3003134 RepID=UPI0022870751|nr:MetQ/NlpA family ABC transporter substrate-binding protein [Phreatobacter sp. AB_2022a]MCZ0732868.1 MetQ/NlpA family ABC transporter substrate-binding protein [Phreatobacter sp. AB_2022a]